VADIDDVYEFVLAAEKERRYNAWRLFEPYPKQQLFMDLGAQYPERLLIAGNQVGKSDTGAYETSCHATGIYPPWWKGLRFDQNTGPCDTWVGGTSGIATRDGPQAKLFGPPGVDELLGTGFIPKSAIIGQPSSGRSATASFDTAHIRHISGGISSLGFKSYEQDRRHWQGTTKKFIWFDEEPPEEIYTEGLARLAATGGSHILTFTPLFGFSEVVKRFLEPDAKHPEFMLRRTHVQMALTDAKHMEDRIAAVKSSYPMHEWAARINGDPHMTGGKIFSAAAEDLMEPKWAYMPGEPGLMFPAHWPLLWGIDFGIDHPFAAVLLAWDRDLDAGHILAGFRVRDSLPLVHADMIRRIAANVPVAWPHDGHVRDSNSGEEMSRIYKKHGLNMLGEHATHPSGGYSTEAGLMDLETAMRRGGFKVNNQMTDWFQEYRLYHRDKEGKIVKEGDDFMSATRIVWMARRHARIVTLGSKSNKPRRDERPEVYNPFTGMKVA
jgi:phage terminase large subunit-like protein